MNLVEFFKTCSYREFKKWMINHNIANSEDITKGYLIIVTVHESLENEKDWYYNGLALKTGRKNKMVYNLIGSPITEIDPVYTLQTYYGIFKRLATKDEGFKKILNDGNMSVIITHSYEDCVKMNKDNEVIMAYFNILKEYGISWQDM